MNVLLAGVGGQGVLTCADILARSAMEGWITANPKGKHGKHSYHLEDYGISRNEVEELFSDYVSRYDLPMDV